MLISRCLLLDDKPFHQKGQNWEEQASSEAPLSEGRRTSYFRGTCFRRARAPAEELAGSVPGLKTSADPSNLQKSVALKLVLPCITLAT